MAEKTAGTGPAENILFGGLVNQDDALNDGLVGLFNGAVAVGDGGVFADGVHHFHAAQHSAKGGVLAVQMGGRLMHDKELGAGAVRVHGAGHGQNAPLVGQHVFHAVHEELALDGLFRAAGAVAQRVAALDHEAADDAVEGEAVVELLVDQVHKIFHGDGSHVRIELGHDGAVVLHVNLDVHRVGRLFGAGTGQNEACQQKNGQQYASNLFHLQETSGLSKWDYRYAVDLVRDIKESGADVCIGGACYPEIHPESENQADDIKHLKEKVDAGCSFLTTQMFFDNNLFYNFLYKIREAGILVPVIPGIMPITNAKQVERAINLSGSFMPQRFKSLVDKFGHSPETMLQAGIIYATDQIIDLFANGIKNVHVYSMNNPFVAEKIKENLSNILG